MIYPTIAGAIRPNRLTEEKDEDYHCRWGRWILQTCGGDQILIANSFKYHVNWQFYKGNQWIFNEDLEVFLKDNSNSMRNRVRWTYNQILPQVNAYVGNVAGSSYVVRAFNTNPEVSKYKERERRKRLMAFNLAQLYPAMANQLTQQYDLGKSIQETEDNFERGWVDYSTIAINALFRHEEMLSGFDELKEDSAETLGIGGISIIKSIFRGSEQYWDPKDPRIFLYDTKARRKNLSDAEYMGDIELPIATELYEQYPNIDREAIERAIKLQRPAQNINRDYMSWFGAGMDGVCPKYNLYWHDCDKETWGFVKDEDDYVCMKHLMPNDHKDPDTGEPAKYTLSMVIPRDELKTENQKKMVEASGMTFRYPDSIRHIEFTPKELVGTDKDIVYSSGLLPFQEVYHDNPYESVMPYKIATYIYRNGEIIAPVDGSIDVQRMMNRFLSMSEAMMNNARGSSIIYDKSIMADEKNGEFQFLDKMNRGEPIGVDAGRYGGNVQNLAVPYTGGESVVTANGMMGIIDRLRVMNQNVTSMNDDATGNSSDQTLVHVQENNIAQSGVVNRKFYSAISRQFLDVYKCIANSGRRFYAQNEYEFIDMIGEEAFQQIAFSKDMLADRFHVSLRVISNQEASIEENNVRLIELYQFGIANPNMAVIGKEEFARLYNSAETDQVHDAILRYLKKADAAAAQMQEQQGQRQERQIALAQQQDASDKQHDLDKLNTASAGKLEREKVVGIKKFLELSMKEKSAKEKIILQGQQRLKEIAATPKAPAKK